MKTFSLTTRKNIRALLVAPFAVFPAVCFLYLVLFFYALATNEVVSTTGLVDVGLIMAFLGWIFAVVLTFFYGLPMALLLQRINKFKLSMLLPVSMFPTLITLLVTKTEYGILFIYAYSSVIVAITYWFMFNKKSNGK
ncbi:hypothetical protein Q4561_11695 [Alteromonas sp. 1_MG-2023]|uniref:hypothetical protein n=1 Tax=Alteromonas sp. 1_MG-2023 TaxID=3062669 RepID=UPI0026E1E119|nr:hypothetical protein [Alteromonas sp. 1_MG-2023]MDO6567723.1 hypothetical protein [Alteromonas sp. 1_MG-2023]